MAHFLRTRDKTTLTIEEGYTTLAKKEAWGRGDQSLTSPAA